MSRVGTSVAGPVVPVALGVRLLAGAGTLCVLAGCGVSAEQAPVPLGPSPTVSAPTGPG